MTEHLAYEKLYKIAEGSYGKVYKAKTVATGAIVALKLTQFGDMECGVHSSAIREVAMLKELSACPHIVKLLDVIPKMRENCMYLVFEYCANTLKDQMDKTTMAPAVIHKLAQQLLQGISFCHAHRVMHRDLKPQNILLTAEGELKIADFGLARPISSRHNARYSHEAVTLWYRSPEMLLGSTAYSAPVDMWSFGCIFAEMLLNGRPLFPGDSEMDMLYRIFRTLGSPTEDVWPGVTALENWKDTLPKWPPKSLATMMPQIDAVASKLLAGVLVLDPQQRLRADKALAHEYFCVVETEKNELK